MVSLRDIVVAFCPTPPPTVFVTVESKTVPNHLGLAAVIRDTRSRRVLAETRPLFLAQDEALWAACGLARSRGWTVVEEIGPE